MTARPLVTVLIPAVNEAADIAGCLGSIAAQDYTGPVEVVLVDGASADDTVVVARAAAVQHGLSMVVVDNPARRTSTSLNAGLDVARGDVIVRVDARSRVEPHYIRSCVATLASRSEVGVTGGAQLAQSRGRDATSIGIARALRNRWATGLARYRRSTTSGPADTVWMGAFRTEELRRHGGWDPRIALNEDFDLNARYRAAGRVVWFDADLRSGYLPRPSVAGVARQYFRFGRVKGTWWARDRRPSPRQLALLLVPLVAGGLAIAIAAQWGVLVAVATGFVGLATLESVGADGPSGGVRARLVAATAIVVMAGAWWVGVVAGWFGERAGVAHAYA